MNTSLLQTEPTSDRLRRTKVGRPKKLDRPKNLPEQERWATATRVVLCPRFWTMAKPRLAMLPERAASADREERIRQRAYQLWEEDGAPEGRERRNIGIARVSSFNRKSEPKVRLLRQAVFASSRLSVSPHYYGRGQKLFPRRPDNLVREVSRLLGSAVHGATARWEWSPAVRGGPICTTRKTPGAGKEGTVARQWIPETLPAMACAIRPVPAKADEGARHHTRDCSTSGRGGISNTVRDMFVPDLYTKLGQCMGRTIGPFYINRKYVRDDILSWSV
jgi:hypothetical protein